VTEHLCWRPTIWADQFDGKIMQSIGQSCCLLVCKQFCGRKHSIFITKVLMRNLRIFRNFFAKCYGNVLLFCEVLDFAKLWKSLFIPTLAKNRSTFLKLVLAVEYKRTRYTHLATTETGFLNGECGRKPQVNLRSRARCSNSIGRAVQPDQWRALGLRLTWGFLPHSPFKKLVFE